MRFEFCLLAVGERRVQQPTASAVIGDLAYPLFSGQGSSDLLRMEDRVPHNREWRGVVEEDTF